jgi:hypothetical protein
VFPKLMRLSLRLSQALKTWTPGLCLVLVACPSRAREAPHLRKELVNNFAAMADSLSFGDTQYGWSECCWETWLVLRPRGAWTLVHVDSVVKWFESPADSAVFRTVTARLVELGFTAGWPSSLGATTTDVPVATLTLRAPGQCHQVTVSPDDGRTKLPAEWLAARAVLDSLAANVGWVSRSPPAWAVADRFTIASRFMCGPLEVSVP